MATPCRGPLCACRSRQEWRDEAMTEHRPRGPRDVPRSPPGRPRRDDQDTERTVAVISKSTIADLRVRLTRFKGHDLVDVRLFQEPDDSDERMPTKRGITLRVDRLHELVDALRQAEAEARRTGLLE
jgi:hypothetical protein